MSVQDLDPAPRILLVDDDAELVQMLKEYLEREGFEVESACDGAMGVTKATSGAYGIIVLDMMMPRMGGVEALRRIRASSRVPVLMLTAKGEETDRIIGLELGADDYVPKPCTPRELTARIRAILRRAHNLAPGSETADALLVGALSIWPDQRRAQWVGEPLELTSTEFNLLELLARNAGRPVSKDVLSVQALGRPRGRFDRSIDVHMSSIRRKLGTTSDGRSVIQTVHGLGYQLLRV